MRKFRILLTVLLVFLYINRSNAFPGDGKDHGEKYDEDRGESYDQGNAPGDPGGGGAPVGPVDDGIAILLAGSIGCYILLKNSWVVKKKIKTIS